MQIGIGISLTGSGSRPGPQQFLGASLLGYWDAERQDKLTLSGTSVTTWTDIAGSYAATQAISGSKPRWDANAFGGVLNKCTNYNSAPPALVTPAVAATFNAGATNVTASGDAAALFGVVDDTAALLAAGITQGNGRVYKIDNTAGVGAAFIRSGGTTGNTNVHAYVAYIRGGSGKVENASIAVLTFSASGAYVRRSGTATPGSTGDQIYIRADAGQVVYFILNGLYEGSSAPVQDVMVAGAATYAYGRPGVIFDGSDDELTVASQPFPTAATACEIWALVDQSALGADATTRVGAGYGGGVVATQRRITRTVTTGTNRGGATTGDGASSVSSSNTAVDLSGRHVLRGVFGAAATRADVDGQAGGEPAVVPATASTRVRLGASPNDTAASFWQGQMAAVLVTSALSTDQAAQLLAYLKSRGGIA